MFFHLVRNNMFAPTARLWVLSGDVIDGKLIWSDAYGEDVKLDMARLVKKAIAGEIVDDHSATYAHHLGRVVKGLNPGTCPPNPQQLAALRKSATIQTPAPGPKRKRPKPHAGLRYPPTHGDKTKRLSSGLRFIPKLNEYWTTYWDGQKWVQRKLIPGFK